jgi:catechol 2,3-dioxygenase-like lactoylglutathione lyase family enzyme
MITGIDHVVILVGDLPGATRRYEELGFAVEAGGEHPGWGTENALIPLADGSYLVLLAASDPALAARHPLWKRPDGGMRGPGEYGGFALTSSDVSADAAAIRSRGLELEGPLEGSRLRPDGWEVRWHLAFPKAAGLPFIIEDETPREVRIAPPVRGLGAAATLDEVEVLVRDLARATRAYERFLGVPAAHGRRGRRHHASFQTPLGQIVLRGPGAVDPARRVEGRLGSGVHSITIRIDSVDGLPPALAHALRGTGPARQVDTSRTGGVRMAIRMD